jgi:hypothetical protein
MQLVKMESPNQSDRIHGDAAVRLVVVHTPEGSYNSAINTCMTPSAKVSYHRIYKKDGHEATQLVNFSKKAWHAGAVNSLSDGLSVEGHAKHFDLKDPGTMELARGVAERLYTRKLPVQWTTDSVKGGFCRHADLQDDRHDPTDDLAEWRLFVGMVKDAYIKIANKEIKGWPKPVPQWFWAWARWKLGHGEYAEFGPGKGPRPSTAPRVIPVWAWNRLRALLKEQKK